MQIGYARTSTVEQEAGFLAQLRDLEAAGCKRIFKEQISGVDSNRPQLQAALDYSRDGDVLICTKLDRLGRSVADIVKIEERLREREAALKIITPNMDTSTPEGRLSFTVLAAVAQFEREIMLSRQAEGMAKAREEGKFRGRCPTAAIMTDEVLHLLADGVGPSEVARRLGIGRSSVHRISKGSTVRPSEEALSHWHRLAGRV
jgi:DNA invertase Pin-like site-specific DNA recombinase